MTATSTRLFSHEELRALSAQVFLERRCTLDEAAATYDVEALQGHVASIWSDFRPAVEAAPESAFARRPDDADGADVWAVGQVISHLCDTQVRSQGFWEALLQTELPAPPARVYELHGAQLLDRRQSLEALDGLDLAWSELMAHIPPDLDPDRRAQHPAFGSAGIKGSLLVFSIHLDSHLHQIRDLYDA
jgi:hypothetical protein